MELLTAYENCAEHKLDYAIEHSHVIGCFSRNASDDLLQSLMPIIHFSGALSTPVLASLLGDISVALDNEAVSDWDDFGPYATAHANKDRANREDYVRKVLELMSHPESTSWYNPHLSIEKPPVKLTFKDVPFGSFFEDLNGRTAYKCPKGPMFDDMGDGYVVVWQDAKGGIHTGTYCDTDPVKSLL